MGAGSRQYAEAIIRSNGRAVPALLAKIWIVLMMNYDARLMRKQARLSQKLERVKAKLANRAHAMQIRRDRAARNPHLATFRGIISLIAFGGLWWLGHDRVNSFIDEIFGDATPASQQHPPGPRPQTFWTFGRRRRSGQSEIQTTK